MQWELEALKILARNPTVPSIALKDTISEIEILRKEVDRLRKDKKTDRAQLREDAAYMAGLLDAIKGHGTAHPFGALAQSLEAALEKRKEYRE